MNSRYGAGTGIIWLDNVQCNGTESDIAYCSHGGRDFHNCDHSKDVSVSCASTPSTTSTGKNKHSEHIVPIRV